MKGILIHFKKLDWIIIVISLLLVGIGLLSIYSSSLGRGDFLNFKKQAIFLGLGFSLMILFSFFDWRVLRDNPYLILILYFLCLAALAGLFFFAPEIRQVKSWYKLGPFVFDPEELAKIILIILLAKFFSTRHIEMYQMKHIFLSGLYVFFPSFLVFFQPDFGAFLILITLWTIILIVSGIKIRHFLILVLIGLLFLILSWSFLLKDYQKERIISFAYQSQIDPRGIGWSQHQAEIAIGSGGIFGQGIGRGSQTQYGFLTVPQADFIFSAIAEEMGLMGVIALLLLLSILIWRILKIALSAETNFPRLFASGFAAVLFSQIFIHIGMNLGLLPIIGIPLPLVSYGGSGLIITFIGLGILQSIKINQ
jgi:rod shape determining protein RodA